MFVIINNNDYYYYYYYYQYYYHYIIIIIIIIVHRCGANGSMRACHEAGPGSIPGRDRFPG